MAVLKPEADGVNITTNVEDDPGAIVVLGAVVTVKSAALVPEKAIELTVNAPAPVFWIRKVFEMGVPTTLSPKSVKSIY